MRRGMFLAGALLAASIANATEIYSSSTQVGYIHTYPNFGNGDVIFTLVTPVSGCSGFWLPPSDPGFKQTYGMLALAKATQANVVVYAYNDQIWPGSPTGSFCRVSVFRVD